MLVSCERELNGHRKLLLFLKYVCVSLVVPMLCGCGSKSLRQVIKQEDHVALREILERQPADANTPDAQGHTRLYWAAYMGDIEAVWLLLDYGADATANNSSALSQAVSRCVNNRNCNPRVVKLLLESGAEPHAECLQSAIVNQTNEIAIMLLDHGVDVSGVTRGRPILTWCASHGSAEIASMVIDRGVDLEAVSQYVYEKSGTSTVRMWGVAQDGAKYDVTRVSGPEKARAGTALMAAAYYGNLGIVQLLLDKAANPNALDEIGRTVLMNAAEKGHVAIVQYSY